MYAAGESARNETKPTLTCMSELDAIRNGYEEEIQSLDYLLHIASSSRQLISFGSKLTNNALYLPHIVRNSNDMNICTPRGNNTKRVLLTSKIMLFGLVKDIMCTL